jgi:hypothetical protein
MKNHRETLIKSERLYYLCDTRSVVGNCLSFWRKEGKGYSCDLNQAEVYTEAKAMRYHKDRETDVPMPKDLLDSLAHRHIDHQDIDRIVSDQTKP